MGTYFRLVDCGNQSEKEKTFLLEKENNLGHVYLSDANDFLDIPEQPFIYWFSNNMKNAYKTGKCLSEIAEPKAGLATGNNDIFQRCWFEVDYCKIGFCFSDVEETKEAVYKWYPCNSGGYFRKWYPYNLYVVDWHNNGQVIKLYKNNKGKLAARPQNTQFYFKEGITWNKISTSKFAVEYKEKGFIYDDTSRSAFVSDDISLFYLLGMLCSNIAFQYLKGLNPTMSFTNGDISRIPYIEPKDESDIQNIERLVSENISFSREEFDDFERSWNFRGHCFIKGETMGRLIEEKYREWEIHCDNRFEALRKNEEEINRHFIEIYGMSSELSENVSNEEITITRANLIREIKSLISYAVGCIMGRYSLKEEGLIYAGGQWDVSHYSDDFRPCDYGVMLITEDQYFEEDLCTRVIDFIEVVYGKDTLNENLNFIAQALKPGAKESARQVIRNYLYDEKGFFDNHYQVYQHRPIYWMMSSGKNGGFRAIVYMHRYDQNTLSIVRSEFLHELRYKYEADQSLQHKKEVEAATTADRNDAKKKVAALDKKMVEINQYDDLVNHATGNITAFTFDLDDGVKTNYSKFLSIDGVKTQNLLVPIKL